MSSVGLTIDAPANVDPNIQIGSRRTSEGIGVMRLNG